MTIGTSVHAITDFGNDTKPFCEALRDIADCGFDSVMLMHRPLQPALTPESSPPCSLIDLEISDPATVRDALEDAGLALAIVYQSCMNVNTDEDAAESALQLQDLMRLAKRLGASTVVCNAGAAPQAGMLADEKEDLIERVACVMMSALDTGPSDVRIAIDTHYGAAVETVADCLRLFDLAPDARAGITLNIGHMTTCRQQGWELLEQSPERVHVVAWKDHLISPPPEATHPVYSVELGTGDSPFEEYLDALPPDDGTLQHLITFEHVPLPEKKEALRRSLQYLRGLCSDR